MESLMNVYVVLFEHDNGSGVMGVYENLGDAEEAMEEYELAAEENHDVVNYYIELHPVE
jgi:hypothetical protein